MLRRNRIIREKIVRYTSTAKEGLARFDTGISDYCENGEGEVEKWLRSVHKRESECDLLRREIEIDLFKKSLLPETREDLMNLLEALDMIINTAEASMRKIYVEHLKLPEELCQPMTRIAHVSVQAGILAMDMAVNALEDGKRAIELDREIDLLESTVDSIQQETLYNLFDSDMELAGKLMIRDIIEDVAQISDLAEDASSRIMVFLAKRHG